MYSSDSDEEFFSDHLAEYELASSESEFSNSADSSDSFDDSDPPYTPGTQLSFELPSLAIQEFESPVEGTKKRGSAANSNSEKRLRVWSNNTSKATKGCLQINYIGEAGNMNTITPAAVFDISVKFPKYFEPGTDWEKRTKFVPNRQIQSQSGLLRTDIYAYAIEANKETTTQIAKQTYRRCLSKLNTPIERFFPELWDNERRQWVSSFPFQHEPYEDALKVIRTPEPKFAKVPLAMQEPSESFQPPPEHTFSEEGEYLLDSDEPIDFFHAIFR